MFAYDVTKGGDVEDEQKRSKRRILGVALGPMSDVGGAVTDTMELLSGGEI